MLRGATEAQALSQALEALSQALALASAADEAAGECCAPFILKNYHKHTLEYSGTNFGRFWNFWFWVKIWLMTDRKYPAIEHRNFTVLGYASTNLHHQISKNSTFKAK